MKKLVVFISVFILNVNFILAQSGFKGLGGRIVELGTTTSVIGSPFLEKDWINADIVMSNGDKYRMSIKYNQLENVLYFKDEEGNANTFKFEVKQFSLVNEDNIYRSFANGGNFFFNVIYDGKIKLIYRDAKYLQEVKEYNSASVIQKITSANKYYLVKPDSILIEIRLNKKDLLLNLGNKEEELSKYIDSEKLNLSKVADLKKLLIYYDQL